MMLQLYDEGRILAPLKCGTRYLDAVFNLTDAQRQQFGITQSEIKSTLFFPNIHTLIVRPPKEHLYSALHTDILTTMNNEDFALPIRKTDINSLMHSYTKRIDWCTGHWHPKIYETLYWMWRRNKERIKVVELRNLSNHLTDLGFELPLYKKEDYQFLYLKNYCSIDEMMLFLKTNYPMEWENIEIQIEKSNVFYEYLINGEMVDIQLI
jgi:hypothetical protein